MAASIHTLIADCQYQLKQKGSWFNDVSDRFTNDISKRLCEQFGAPDRNPTLRLSQMGPKCPCALWHSIHTPEKAESLPAWAEFKYAYGHVIEAMAIGLAKAANHNVEGEQDELCVDGVYGHRDAVIDGCIVDVKSTSSLGFAKFKSGSIQQDDSFGYLDQLDGYLVGSNQDPLVQVKDKGYILAIDKTLGHMVLYEHKLREQHIRDRISSYKQIVSNPSPPRCTCGVRSQGVSGNLQLDTVASYSPWKYCCFPNLRIFLYANGPIYLTKVVRRPDVPEVDRYGNFIY